MTQASLSLVRRVAQSLARRIRTRHTTWPEEGFIIPDTEGQSENDLRCSLILQQTTLNPNIFGMIILVENYFCDMKGVNSYLDFTIVIENTNDSLISSSQVIIRDIERKLWEPRRDEIKEYIAEQWNK